MPKPPFHFIWTILLFVSMSYAGAAHATDPARNLHELQHTAWTPENGAPEGIIGFSQTPDGFLWLGTAGGMYRFDGVRFEPLETLTTAPLPGSKLAAVFGAPSGALWFGLITRDICRFWQSTLTCYSFNDGVKRAATGFAEDLDGTVWAATGKGLIRLKAGHWQPSDIDWPLTSPYVRHVFVDRDGTLWATTSDKVFYRSKGTSKFVDSGVTGTWPDLSFAKNGDIWVTDAEHGVRKLGIGTSPQTSDRSWRIKAETGMAVSDRDGALWAGTVQGIVRVARGSTDHMNDNDAERYAEADGLSGNYIHAMLEDREGSIWVVTNAGLDRFRETAFVPVAMPPRSQFFYLTPGSDGSVWISSTTHGLTHYDKQGREIPTKGVRGVITDMYTDSSGLLWLGSTEAGVGSYDGEWHPLKNAPKIDEDNSVQTIVGDLASGLWVSIIQSGLYRYHENEWTRNGGLAGLPEVVPVVSARDPDGTLWFGYPDNRLALVRNTTVSMFAADNGPQLGDVTSIDPHGTYAWIGGDTGLSFYDGRRFIRIRPEENVRFESITGIRQDESANLWLNTGHGAMRVQAAELNRARVDAAYRVRVSTYSYLDGVKGRFTENVGYPSLVESTDRRLWFGSATGVAWIDPRHIYSNAVPPTIHIESINADGKLQYRADRLAIEKLTRNLRIDYTAASLAVPERVVFRYRLTGIDPDWQAAGSRRSAYYNNLKPGKYRFSVMAANDAGVWSRSDDSVEIEMPPAFYQTKWFIGLVVIIIAAFLWLLYQIRLQQVGARMRSRLQDRLGERERIARTLHDVLLQSMQGLILRFQTIADKLPQQDSVRALMEKELDRADSVLAEGRDQVAGLRGTTLGTMDLSSIFTSFADGMENEQGTQFQLAIEGKPVALHPVAQEEIVRIGCEAISNAFRHAHASRIELELTYGKGNLSLRVRDDGVGMNDEMLVAGERPGHWGLVGIRERAKKVEAKVEFWSRPGAGTEVALVIPAAVAYRDTTTGWVWFRRDRFLDEL